jgi:hypothetical protein
MKNSNFARQAGVAVALSTALLSMQVAAETTTADIGVAVNNAITFVKNTDLNFGDVRAKSDAIVDTCNGLFLPANPAQALRPVSLAADATLTGGTNPCATGVGTAVMTSLGTTPATRASFTVSGAANFTPLTVKVPQTVVLENPNPLAPDFLFTYPIGFRTSAPTADIIFTAGSAVVTTDGSGGFAFNLGGALVTNPGANAVTTYDDTTYTASMTVEVTY